ncbi:methionine adenosyltransferase [[Mycoplasma] testudinis]|uniref:methionine adenosyltransferase n=1 Tax=[Mycoplasma] testudinis TaxID=33924 RepID=UPI0005632CA4|nr:methionine adenosyltransferase [[Mycoplasma] testudinis]
MSKAYAIHHYRKGFYTSESVSKGHPDKICDQIADAILDKCLFHYTKSRVACEVLASNRLIIIGGEISTASYVDVVQTAWDIISPLGYNENDFTIISNIHEQSIDIANLVNHNDGSLGAGDQGITIGYAVAETQSLMPLGTQLAHQLLAFCEHQKQKGLLPEIKSDMKSQVTLNYQGNQVKIHQILMSVQHDVTCSLETLKNKIMDVVIVPLLTQLKVINNKSDIDFEILINPAGRFVIGGPIGDTGLTGRKLMVDTYGNYAHHGGGAFSGKDPTKVDRTGAYYARWIAKHIVANNWASECEVSLSWAIGLEKPQKMNINCFNTNRIPLEKITRAVSKVFDFDLLSIIEELHLTQTLFLPFATYGHFGREQLIAPWENLKYLRQLKETLE